MPDSAFYIAEDTVANIRLVATTGDSKKISFSDGSSVVLDPSSARILTKYLGTFSFENKRKMAERLNNNLVDFMNVLDDAYNKLYG